LSLDDCITQFASLCSQAFTPRELHNVPLLGKWAAINHGSKHKTLPLYKALRRSLGEEEYLFGGVHAGDDSCDVKVAVTSTEELGRKAIILANYTRSEHRPEQSETDHEFIRPDKPQDELLLWEAGAATAAAPTYFKPFLHHRSHRSFLDGALYNNNPVKVVQKERKLLWPEVAEQHPDVFLSVGTGQDAKVKKMSGSTTTSADR
jgi:hypothetical protein